MPTSETGPGTTRINALTNFLRNVHCSNCGANADAGLKLVESKVDKEKVKFTLKCFNVIDKKGLLGGESKKATCGNTTPIELPLEWGSGK